MPGRAGSANAVIVTLQQPLGRLQANGQAPPAVRDRQRRTPAQKRHDQRLHPKPRLPARAAPSRTGSAKALLALRSPDRSSLNALPSGRRSRGRSHLPAPLCRLWQPRRMPPYASLRHHGRSIAASAAFPEHPEEQHLQTSRLNRLTRSSKAPGAPAPASLADRSRKRSGACAGIGDRLLPRSTENRKLTQRPPIPVKRVLRRYHGSDMPDLRGAASATVLDRSPFSPVKIDRCNRAACRNALPGRHSTRARREPHGNRPHA